MALPLPSESTLLRATSGRLPQAVVVLQLTLNGEWPSVFLNSAVEVRAAFHPALVERLCQNGWVREGNVMQTQSIRAVRALTEHCDPRSLTGASGRRLWRSERPSTRARRVRDLAGGATDGLARALDATASAIAASEHLESTGICVIERRGRTVKLVPHFFRADVLDGSPIVHEPARCVPIEQVDCILERAQERGVIVMERSVGGIGQLEQWRDRLVVLRRGEALNEATVVPFRPSTLIGAAERTEVAIGGVNGVEGGARRLLDLGELVEQWWNLGIEIVVDADVADLADVAFAGAVGRNGLLAHQDRFCSRYAATSRGLVCAMPPGSGKTAAACVSLAERSTRSMGQYRGLVLAPAGVLSQWQNEVTRWAPGLPLVEDLTTWLEHGGVFLTGERAAPEIAQVIGSKGLYIDDLVVDEAAGLHRSGVRPSSLWAVRNRARRGLVLTGTPVQRSSVEMAALIAFARGRSISEYAEVAKKARRAGLGTLEPAVTFDADGKRWMREINLRTVPCETDARVLEHEAELLRARDALDAAEHVARTTPVLGPEGMQRRRGADQARRAVLDAARRLVRTQAESAAPALLEEVAQRRGVLVCCDDRSVVDLYARALAGAVVLDGRTAPDRRAAIARQFQQGVVDVLILGRVASVGLNLQRAALIVMADLPLDPALLRQRIGRAARVGHDGTALEVIVAQVGRSGAAGVSVLRDAVRGGTVLDGADELSMVALVCDRVRPI